MKTLHDKTTVPDDTPTQLINGKRYLMTADQISDQQALDLQIQSSMPMENWRQQMVQSDAVMTRVEEDIITQIGVTHFSTHVQQKYNDKAAIRAQKPS